MRFELNIDKAIESCHYILNKLDAACDFHKLFKILYFAEQKHISDYGRPISGDLYIAMNNGPVPSFIYDVLKHIRGDNPYFSIDKNLEEQFEVVDRFYVGSKRQADIRYLSQSDRESLEKSIEENATLNFEQLTSKSHGSAWQKATRDNEISIIDIAEEGGANTEMLKYISMNIPAKFM